MKQILYCAIFSFILNTTLACSTLGTYFDKVANNCKANPLDPFIIIDCHKSCKDSHCVGPEDWQCLNKC